MGPVSKRLMRFALMVSSCCSAGPAMAGGIASIDLAKPFGAASAWRFTATQGPDIADPTGPDGEKEAGPVTLCISKDGGRSCRPDVQRMLRLSRGDDLFAEPHFLNDSRIVHPALGRALLLLQTASVHSGDGDQRMATQILGYDRTKDAFAPVYAHQTRRNNNQEIRYVEGGPLMGAMISADPTDDAPYGYWMVVSRLSPGEEYRQVLRYRSATRYGDGNALAVIDSEMPAIQQKLGLWHPGSPLPLPKGGCARPHLVRGALWCD